MNINSSIGIFDSGLGGLSVLKQFIRFLPYESYVYLGDTARVPYGNKSVETVGRYAEECTEFLIKKDVKLIVVACNTVSSNALDNVTRVAKDIPVIGMIRPGSLAAYRTSQSKRIGIIGTRATINSKSYEIELKNLSDNQDINIYSKACPLFVPLVEEGMLNNDATKQIAHFYLDEFKSKNIDTLILACTHYPLLANFIKEILPYVNLIDSGEHSSVSALRLLAERKLLKEEKNIFIERPDIKFFVTDLPQNFHIQARSFLGFDVDSPELIDL